jgi:surfeit locus 1 family protein
VDFRRVTATGTYLHDTAFVLGISGRDGEPGGTLVTPLRLEDGRVLLVERGWVPESAFPPHTPEALEPQGPQEVSGILRWRGDARPNPFTPASDPERRQFYWHDLEGMANLVGEPLLPAVLVRTGAPGGLPATPAVAVDYRNDHLSYAITWYSLAAILVVFYVMVGLRRGQG